MPLSVVAPYAGAWIEILDPVTYGQLLASLLMQERGLKSYRGQLHSGGTMVAPYAGAWIEILY